MEKICLNCQHADFKTPLASNMSFRAKCKKPKDLVASCTYYTKTSKCPNGCFEAAAENIIQYRLNAEQKYNQQYDEMIERLKKRETNETGIYYPPIRKKQKSGFRL